MIGQATPRTIRAIFVFLTPSIWSPIMRHKISTWPQTPASLPPTHLSQRYQSDSVTTAIFIGAAATLHSPHKIVVRDYSYSLLTCSPSTTGLFLGMRGRNTHGSLTLVLCCPLTCALLSTHRSLGLHLAVWASPPADAPRRWRFSTLPLPRRHSLRGRLW